MTSSHEPSGPDPIEGKPLQDDPFPMITAIRLPEPSTTDRHGRFGRTGRPLAPHTDGAPNAPEAAAVHPGAARYANYVVDPEAVAAALVERLMAGRGLDLRGRE
jgi:hypothetical protein